MHTIQVMLVDDHPIFRSGIRYFLEQEPDIRVLAEAGNGIEALEVLATHYPDVLLVDLRMPKMNGVALIKEIRLRQIQTRVIILSGYYQMEDIHDLFSAGIHGYLLKDELPEMIIEAIRGVAHGQSGWVSRKIASAISATFRTKPKTALSLTRREEQVLRAVTEGKTNTEIAYNLSISEKTVEKHLQGILSKLGVENRVEAAVFAIRQNIL